MIEVFVSVVIIIIIACLYFSCLYFFFYYNLILILYFNGLLAYFIIENFLFYCFIIKHGKCMISIRLTKFRVFYFS